jgi:hypothetical protein
MELDMSNDTVAAIAMAPNMITIFDFIELPWGVGIYIVLVSLIPLLESLDLLRIYYQKISFQWYIDKVEEKTKEKV